MPGQVVEDSILGDNKEKTKLYWEHRMRNDVLEQQKDKHNGLNKLRSRSSSTTSPVIQKINAEIEEFNRREKELKSSSSVSKSNIIGSVMTTNEEEDDVFSSNGSSVDEFEPAESPRLESGFYSNVGEDEQLELLKTIDPLDSESGRGQVVKVNDTISTSSNNHITPAHQNEKLEELTLSTNGRSLSNSLESLKVTEVSSVTTPSPTVEAQVKSEVHHEEVTGSYPNHLKKVKVFKFQKETPIEKEIRLASERDEEYRLRRLSSMGESQSVSVSPKTPTAASEPKTPSTVAAEEKQRYFTFKHSAPRNVQYQMATERLRRELLEAKQREDELRTIHRTVSMTTLQSIPQVNEISPVKVKVEAEVSTPPPTPTILFTQASIEEEPKALSSETHVDDVTESVTTSQPPKVVDIPEDEKVEEKRETMEEKREIIEEKRETIEEKREIIEEKRETIEVIRKTSTNDTQPTMSSIVSSAQFWKSPKGKLGFNSIERYLLKSSMKLRINKNFQLPPPPKPTVEKKIEEPITPVEEELNEPEIPRRKLIPATQKIQKELREMQEREKELALLRTRSFKSTPNLAIRLDSDEVKVKDLTTTQVYEPKERKRSTLINQWEEIINRETEN